MDIISIFKKYLVLFGLLMCYPHPVYQEEITSHEEILEEKKEEIKELILEGEDMYLRAMTIMMDAGARYFCWSLEMEPEQMFNMNYKVNV